MSPHLMPHLPTLIADLALILMSADIITLLFKWLRQPLALGYIIAGLLAGPYVDIFPTIGNTENIDIWAEIGIILLLSTLGLEFNFKKLVNVGSAAFVMAITEVINMLLIGYLVGQLLGWGTMNSIFLGGMLSMSSTTIIIKAFNDLGLRDQHFTGIIFGTLVVKDLIAILVMVLLSTMAMSQNFMGEDLLISMLKVVFFLILWFLIGVSIIPAFLRKAKKLMNNKTLLIVSLGFYLEVVVLATYAGLSTVLGTFTVGSILAETVETEHIKHIVQPVKDLFGAIFFISVGMLVNPTVLIGYAWPVIIIALATIISKTIFSSFGVLLSGEPLNTSIKSGFSLAQIGEFAFIIAGLGASLKVLDPFISPVIMAVSIVTTFATPYFIRLVNPFAEWLYKVLLTRVRETLDRYASGEKTMNHDSDWKKLLKNMIGRVVICSVLLTAIWLLSIQVIYPAISEILTPITTWIKLVMCLDTLLLTTPFLWTLISNKCNSSELFLKLQRDGNYSHGHLVPLVLGRVSVALFFTTSVVISYFKLNWGVSVVIAIAVVALILIFREDLTQYSRLETRFLANLNRREEVAKEQHPLKTSFNSEFNGKNLNLTSILISPYSDYIDKSLGELSFRRNFGANVVTVTRGDLDIYIPKSSECIYPQDKLAVIGTDTQLQEFRNRMEDVESTSDTDTVDKKITFHSFTANEGFHFLNQITAQSHLGEKHDSTVVTIERNDELIALDKDTAFQLGNLVWIIGNREKVREILYLA